MHPAIRVSVESERGCGYRHAGIYLVSDGLAVPCGRLPIPLTSCPTCSCGIKPSRGWTWINGRAIAEASGNACTSSNCHRCPLASPMDRVGLLWIGEKYYATPQDWTDEALRLGVSRRIPAVPRGFDLMRTWVWVAHRKCIPQRDGSYIAGVFHAFKPKHVEIVIRGDETDEEIDGLVKAGFRPVKVIRDIDHTPLFGDN